MTFSVIHSHLSKRVASDKKNHKGAETWMLAQRIGPIDTSKVEGLSHASYAEAAGEMETNNLRVPKRIYYDRFVESSDGRLYKGEW